MVLEIGYTQMHRLLYAGIPVLFVSLLSDFPRNKRLFLAFLILLITHLGLLYLFNSTLKHEHAT